MFWYVVCGSDSIVLEATATQSYSKLSIAAFADMPSNIVDGMIVIAGMHTVFYSSDSSFVDCVSVAHQNIAMRGT